MPYFYRALVGPRFDHYDWTGLNAEATTSLDISSTLSSSLTASATSIALASAVTFPTSGGVFVAPGPNSSTQGWEYCRYTAKSGNSLTSVTRESSTTREHTGIHDSGAGAYFWYPITTDNGEISFSWSMNQMLSATQ